MLKNRTILLVAFVLGAAVGTVIIVNKTVVGGSDKECTTIQCDSIPCDSTHCDTVNN